MRTMSAPGARGRGATLIEVLVGTAVFGFLMLASLAIMQLGGNGWRTVESRSEAIRQLNRVESDLIQELRRASLASVGVYTPASDFRWALWMKSPLNSPESVNLVTGAPRVPLGDPLVMILAGGKPVMQRYVLYYVTRPDAALHGALYGVDCASYSSTAGPDTTCPHKWLVKKEIYLLSDKTSGTDTIGLQGDSATAARLKTYLTDASVTEAALAAEQESANPSSTIHRVQILAQSLLSFEVTRLAVNASDPLEPPTVSPTGPIVLFDLKVYKSLLASNRVTVGTTPAATVTMKTVASGVSGNQMVEVQSSDTRAVHTVSAVLPTYSPYTVQLDNRVIPENP